MYFMNHCTLTADSRSRYSAFGRCGLHTRHMDMPCISQHHGLSRLMRNRFVKAAPPQLSHHFTNITGDGESRSVPSRVASFHRESMKTSLWDLLKISREYSTTVLLLSLISGLFGLGLLITIHVK